MEDSFNSLLNANASTCEIVTENSSPSAADASSDAGLHEKRCHQDDLDPKAWQAWEDELPMFEVVAVQSFRKNLIDQSLLRPEDDEFYTLLRFLKSSSMDSSFAVAKWKKSLNWRDTFLGPLSNKNADHSSPNLCTLHGVDKEGRPVSYEFLGNVLKIVRSMSLEEALRVKGLEFQYLLRVVFPRASLASKRAIWQRTQVFDAAGLGFQSISIDAIQFLRCLSLLDSEVFPFMCHRIIVINAGPAFRTIFSTLKHIINPDTVARVLGHNYQAHLFSLINSREVPAELGGTCTCTSGCLTVEKGPWMDRLTVQGPGLSGVHVESAALSYEQYCKSSSRERVMENCLRDNPSKFVHPICSTALGDEKADGETEHSQLLQMKEDLCGLSEGPAAFEASLAGCQKLVKARDDIVALNKVLNQVHCNQQALLNEVERFSAFSKVAHSSRLPCRSFWLADQCLRDGQERKDTGHKVHWLYPVSLLPCCLVSAKVSDVNCST